MASRLNHAAEIFFVQNAEKLFLVRHMRDHELIIKYLTEKCNSKKRVLLGYKYKKTPDLYRFFTAIFEKKQELADSACTSKVLAIQSQLQSERPHIHTDHAICFTFAMLHHLLIYSFYPLLISPKFAPCYSVR